MSDHIHRLKVVPHGNDVAVVIDRATAQRLGFAEASELRAVEQTGSLSFIRKEAVVGDEEFRTIMDGIHQRHGNDLRRLAE